MASGTGKIVHLKDHVRTANVARRDAVLTDILEAHGVALRRFLTVRLRGHVDIEDVIQDIFMRLAALPDVETYFTHRPETLRGYLFTMAANMLRDRARRAQVRQQDFHDEYDDEVGIAASVTPEEFLITKQEVGRISLSNPFVPQVVADESSPSGVRWDRRFAEVGLRTNRNERETIRAWVGLKGTVLDSWDWEAAAAERIKPYQFA